MVTVPTVRSWLRPLVAWSALWWILSGGAAESWIFGAPAVLVTAAVSRNLREGRGRARVRALGLLGFLGYFARQSVRGGWDVARRALSPRPRLRPGFIDHPLLLSPGAPRQLFILGVSLTPGTLSTVCVEGALRVQVLDLDAPVQRELAALEERIAAAFVDATEGGS